MAVTSRKLTPRMCLGITRDGRIVKCASHPAQDLFNAADVSTHWRQSHKDQVISCAQCLAAGIEMTFDPRGYTTDISFQSWYGNNVYKHLETHLAYMPPGNVVKVHVGDKASITGESWQHSPGFKTIDQELYEIASMRRQDLRDLALDLIEEWYFNKYGCRSSIDWKQACIFVEEMLRARGHEMRSE